MNTLLFRNIRSSFIAQLSSIFVSIGMGLILPRFLSVEDYGYWQLFVIYSVCFELLLLGVPNGFFLKNAGRVNSDYSYLKSALITLIVINIAVSIIVILFTDKEELEAFVYYWIGIAIVIVNSGTFFSYILRSENDVRFDCTATILLNISIVAGFSTLFYFNINNIYLVIEIYVLSFVIRDVLLFWRKRVLFCAKTVFTNAFLKDLISDIKMGIKALLIDYTNILMFGICRLICKSDMGVIIFSMLSFALSLVMLAINFVNQVGLSILPALRQLDENSIIDSYIKFRNFTSNLFLTLMITYKPANFVLSLWLPKYADSFVFILILFPLIIYDGKMQTVFSLFLKLLRKETLLLKINMIYLFSSVTIYYLFIYLTHDIKYLIFSILIMSIVRSTIVEFLISKLIKVANFQRKIFLEIATGVIFLAANFVFDAWLAWAYFMIFYIFAFYLNLKKCRIEYTKNIT